MGLPLPRKSLLNSMKNQYKIMNRLIKPLNLPKDYMENRITTSDPYFHILGPMVGEELTFWNIDHGWVDYFDSTPFTGEILTLPLPEGATGVMPFSGENEPVAQYNTLPGGDVFEKVF